MSANHVSRETTWYVDFNALSRDIKKEIFELGSKLVLCKFRGRQDFASILVLYPANLTIHYVYLIMAIIMCSLYCVNIVM